LVNKGISLYEYHQLEDNVIAVHAISYRQTLDNVDNKRKC